MPDQPKGKSAIEGLIAGFSRLAERLEQVSHQAGSGSFEKKPFKGVFGWSVKLGAADKFHVEPFGNVRSDEATGEPRVEENREPLVDVFDEDGEVVIVAELPGVESDDVHVDLEGTRLTLTAEHGERKYRKQLEVPPGIQKETLAIRGQNGIVEIRARRG